MSGAILFPKGFEIGGPGAVQLARTRYQQGELFQRGTNRKVWVGRWREDVVGPDGLKRVKKTVILGEVKDLPTRKLALRALAKKLEEVNSLTYRGTVTKTFGEFANDWRDKLLTQHKPSTQLAIKSQLRRVLMPAFEKVQLNALTPEVLQTFVSKLTCAPKTTRNIVATLRMMWNTAKAWGYVNHDPFKGLVLPQVRKAEPVFFTLEEIQRILDASEEPYRTFYRLAAETGLRAGELCGLRWEDCVLDPGHSAVQVRQSVWRGGTQSPKTANAIRTFAISDGLSQALGQLKRKESVSYVFSTRNGTALDANLIVKRRLHPLLKQLKIKVASVTTVGDKEEVTLLDGVGLHAFRHANASLMDQLQAPVKVRQERLGHSDPTITLGTYTHIVSQDDVAIAKQLGTMLDSGPKLDLNA